MCVDLPGGQSLFQNIQRGFFFGSLAGYVPGGKEDPKDKNQPDDPPDKVHAPKMSFV